MNRLALLDYHRRRLADRPPTRASAARRRSCSRGVADYQDTIPGGGGAGAPRFFALAHIAMFDAVNAIEREFEPYHVQHPTRERLDHRRGGTGRSRRHGGAESWLDGGV